jgi:hypothetical protein
MRFAALFFLSCVIFETARANPHICDLKIEAGSTTINFDDSSQPVLLLTVRRSKNEICEFWVGISRGSSSSYSRELRKSGSTNAPIKYGVFKSPCTPAPPNCSNTQMKDADDATQDEEVLIGAFITHQGSDTQTFTVYPTFALETVNSLSSTNELKPWGAYSDSLMVHLYEGHFPSSAQIPAPDSSLSITTKKTVDKFALVSIVEKGLPYQNPPVTSKTFDLGILTPGSTGEFDLISLFNAGYLLEVSSAQGGKLIATSGTSSIPYEFRIDGALRSLSKGSAIVLGSSGGTSPPPLNGLRNRISVTIPEASLTGALGGTYQDTLTITIQSTE